MADRGRADYSAKDLARAYRLAAKSHSGQTDGFDGAPYLHHVLDVARGVRALGIPYEMVGVLHDTVEHAGVTLKHVRKKFGKEIADGVDAMSKRKGEDFFEDYMPRVLANPIARAVKISDATANREKARRLEDDAEREKKVAKYTRAIEMILAAQA